MSSFVQREFDWFEQVVDETFGYLTEMGLARRSVEHHAYGYAATFLGQDVGVRLDYEPLGGQISTEIVLLENGQIPLMRPIRLDLGALESIEGRTLSRPRLADGYFADRSEVEKVIRRDADALRPHLKQMLSGDRGAVGRVYELLRDLPGDPSIDWWVAPDREDQSV
jgi:hypothetical protein